MKVIVANSVGLLGGKWNLMLFPSRSSGTMNECGWHWYPYELAYLSSYMKKQQPDWDVRMVDGNLRGWGWHEYAFYLIATRPDVVITECAAIDYADMTGAVKAAKLANPKLFTILTGPFGYAFPEKCLQDGWDAVIIGEYEETALEVIRERKPGITRTQKLVDINALPWPEDDDVNRANYLEFCRINDPSIQVFPTRGCPLACTYCVVPTYYGGHGHSFKSFRTRDVGDFCDELAYLKDKHNCNSFFCNDEATNADADWFLSFCQEVQRRELGIYLDGMAGYWTMTVEMVHEMAGAGFKQIRVGIETFDRDAQKQIGKVVFEDKLLQALEWLKRYGISVMGFVQIGGPGATAAKDRASLTKLMELKDKGLLYKWQSTISTPQPGTPYYNECKANDWLVSEDYSLYDLQHALINRPDYSDTEVMQVAEEYWRSKMLRERVQL